MRCRKLACATAGCPRFEHGFITGPVMGKPGGHNAEALRECQQNRSMGTIQQQKSRAGSHITPRELELYASLRPKTPHRHRGNQTCRMMEPNSVN